MKEKLLQLHRDTLLRNSLYLMLSTMVMAVLGFVFWLICARLFTPSEIGVATTLISAMTLISYVSLLGFNSTFVRVLPNSKNRDGEINTGLLLSNSAAILVAALYVAFIPLIVPRLHVLHQNLLYGLGFVLMTSLAATNLLTDSIFIAFRAAKYNLLIDGFIMSLTKLALPFAFMGLGAYGVFAAAGAGASVALVMSVLFLIWKFGYKPQLKLDRSVIKNVRRYSLSNYFANLLNIAPTLVIPLVTLEELGSAAAGYYYLTFMVANLLFTVVYAVAQSLFAEGSYAERHLGELVKRSGAVVAAIIIPSCAVLFFGAHLLLGIYGKAYAQEASVILRILALSAPFVALYTITTVIMRITKQLRALIYTNVVYFVTTSGLAFLIGKHGLAQIGLAWLAGNLAAGLVGVWFVLKHKRSAALATNS